MSRSARSPDRLAALSVIAVGALLGCGGPTLRLSSNEFPRALAYELRVESAAPLRLDIALTLTGGARSLVATVPSAITSVEREDPEGPRPIAAIASRPGAFPVECPSTCRVRYRVDLGAAAEASHDSFEVAVRSGPDLLAPASTWLLRPDPLPPGAPVTIHVAEAEGVRVRSALRRGADPALISLRAIELPAAGYMAFGSFTTVEIPVHGGTIELVLLGGARRLGDDALRAWVARMAGSLDAVFGHFPVQRAAIFVVPEPGSDRVELGRTLPSGGASILLVLGEHAGEQALADDWILEHELFHLGTPSFSGEGRWLDEGLAVYYEPVLRRRAGLCTDEQLWSDLIATSARGLPRAGEGSLSESEEPDRVYGGGATFVLAADVGIRARTSGERSLDDGLRAVLARGGDATQVWTVADFVRAVDQATGVPVMSELHAQSARSSPCVIPARASGANALPTCFPEAHGDLLRLFSWLGVEPREQGLVALRDDAPLARLRLHIEGASAPFGAGGSPPSDRVRGLPAQRSLP